MTLIAVPWMVKEAIHSAESGRSLPYVLSGGREGVAGHADFRVTASPASDGNVHVAGGGASLLNRFAGGAFQGYTVINDGDIVLPIDPEGVGSGRNDLVALIINDTQYPGQPDPASVADGPYVFLHVYENVGSATTVAQVAPNQTGIALAVVSMPSGTATVAAVQITDLRQLVNPRTLTVVRNLSQTSGTEQQIPTSAGVFPTGAAWEIDVPSWANRAVIEGFLPGLRARDTSGNGTGGVTGYFNVVLGSASAEQPFTAAAIVTGKDVPCGVVTIADVEVPSGDRGNPQTLQLQAIQFPAGATAVLPVVFNAIAKVTFYEVPGVN